MRAALINNNGRVVNVVMIDEGDNPPKDHRFVATDEANIGDTFDGARFTRVSDPAKVPARLIAKGDKVAMMLNVSGLTIQELRAAISSN